MSEEKKPRWLPPEGMEFYLKEGNGKNEIWVRFTDPNDGRCFSAKEEAVVALMKTQLRTELGRKDSPSEWEEYRDACYASALNEFRRRPDNEDLRRERNTLRMCVLAMMEMRAAGWRLTDGQDHVGRFEVPEDERLEWIGSQTILRGELELFHDGGSPDWPGVHRGRFGEYLEDHRVQLYEDNIVFSFVKRKSRLRPMVLTWRDITKIPPYVPDETDERRRLRLINKALQDNAVNRKADLYRILHGE